MKLMHAYTLIVFICPTFVLADDYGGKYSGKYTHQEVMPQDQQGQKMVVGSTATGTNKSSGRTVFMDNARVVWGGVTVLEQGQGPEQGIITLAAPDGTAMAFYKGTATMQMGKDGPLVSGKGTWEAIPGTGAYETYAGKGTYTRAATSKTEFEGEWKGSLTKGKSSAEATGSQRR